MAQIPRDLITKILPLLSVKVLLSIRCVSKSLRNIIDSPDFINSHLLLTRIHQKIIIRHRSQLHHINHIPIHVFDISGPFDCPFPPKPLRRQRTSDGCFLAHCNGLVVLEEDDWGLDSLVLWNPSTRRCRKLTVLPNEYLLDKGLCFGYDSSIDDYKVMVMKETKRREPKNHIWILGLRSGYWRRIELPHAFRNRYINKFRNCFVDGAFYFIWSDGVILAFDLAKETFSQVYGPEFDGIKFYTNLVVLEGCLCVRHLSRNNHVELYARKKNRGGEFSWFKLFSIKFEKSPCRNYPSNYIILMNSEVLRFSKDGDKIYLLYDHNYVYAYDFKENNIEMIGGGDKDNQKVFSCIESLVWVNENKRTRKRIRNKKTV